MASDGSDDGERAPGRDSKDEAPQVPMRATVIAVEVMIPPRPSPSDPAISDTFDEVISCIQRLQRAYHLVAQWPMRLVNRESLPPWIPWSSHNLSDRKSPEITGGQVGTYQLHLDLAAHVDPGEISVHDLGEVHSFIDRDFGAFFTFSDLRREAMVALHRRGDYRSAVLATATAAEVFLDDLLLHLLWETTDQERVLATTRRTVER